MLRKNFLKSSRLRKTFWKFHTLHVPKYQGRLHTEQQLKRSPSFHLSSIQYTKNKQETAQIYLKLTRKIAEIYSEVAYQIRFSTINYFNVFPKK